MGTPQNKHGKKNKKSMPWIILMLVMLILMVMCVVYIANYYRSRNESERQYEELKNQVVSYIRAAYKEQNFTFKVNCRRANKQYPVHSD